MPLKPNPLTRGKKQKALALLQARQLPGAKSILEQVCRADPRDAEAWYLCGAVNHESGALAEAETCYRQAVALQPERPEAHYFLGNIYLAQEKLPEAADCYRNVIKSQPHHIEAHCNLGVAMERLGEYHSALQSYGEALRLAPERAELHYNVGTVLRKLGQLDEAERHFRRAIELKPDFAEACNNLANLLDENAQYDQAITLYRQATVVAPDHASMHYNLGLALKRQGKLDEAIRSFRRTLELKPDHVDAHRGLLTTLLYHSGCDHEQMFQEHRRFEAQQAQRLYAHQRLHTNSPDPRRRLRVGYLSSDFCAHPVGFAVALLLEAADRRWFDIFLYAEVPRPDETSARLRACANHWRSTVGLGDEAVAEMIRQDGIDILVCLAGRFDQNRPLVCAYKPAPVQVSLHDAATSGLSAMDYLITDIIMNPRSTTERFTERLVRLPTFHLHTPLPDAPPVAPLPVVISGHVTFGSLNNPAKITPEVIALWSRVLKAVPGSRLLLKYKNLYANEGLRDRCLGLFAQHGINPESLILEARHDTRSDHLKLYTRIDLALDPFPFNGSTTTFESLWMGVPVITLQGNSMVSRWGTSMLTRAGLTKLVAHTEEDYVGIARWLATDLHDLSDLRASLREQVARSPLCNAKARARQLERVYYYMWRKWCQTR